jgi:hypothetical protein
MSTLYPGVINDYTFSVSTPSDDADAAYAAWCNELGVDPAALNPALNNAYVAINEFNFASPLTGGSNVEGFFTSNYVGWYGPKSKAPVQGAGTNGNQGVTPPQYATPYTVYVPTTDPLDACFMFAMANYTYVIAGTGKMQKANGVTIMAAHVAQNGQTAPLLKWAMRFNADGTFVFIGAGSGVSVPLYFYPSPMPRNGVSSPILIGTAPDSANVRVDAQALPPSIPTNYRAIVVGKKIVSAPPRPLWTKTVLPTVRYNSTRDYIYGGDGVISGTVKITGTPNTPTHRKVRLLRDYDSRLIRETWSDPVTGAYTFAGIDRSVAYTVLGIDYMHNFRAVIADNLTPDKMP